MNHSRFREGFTSLFKNFPTALLALISLRIPPLPFGLFFNLLLTSFVVKDKKLRKQGYDLIYAHWLFPAGFVGLLLGKTLHCKTISVIRGYDIQVMPGIEGYGINDHQRILSKYVVEKSDLVIAHHKVHTKIAADLVGPNHRGKVLYLSPSIPDLTKIDAKNRTPPINVENRKDRIPEGKIVLYSPSLEPHYGILDLMEAIPIITEGQSDTLFLVIGDGKLKNEAINLARKKKVADKAMFFGRVAYNIMPDLYRSSVVVCDLCYFGQGTTTLEAFCFGKPVIGINTSKSYIEHGKNGFLVEKGDHRALAYYLSRLLGESKLREEMSKNARKSFEQRFDIETGIAELVKVFNSSALGSASARITPVSATSAQS